jgi:MoxR-like ATPase
VSADTYHEIERVVRREHLLRICADTFAGDRPAAVIGWAAALLDDAAEDARVEGASETALLPLLDLSAQLWTAFVDRIAEVDPEFDDKVPGEHTHERPNLRLISGGAS